MKKTARAFALCFIAAVLSACFLFSAGAEETAPAEMPPVDLDLSCMSGAVVYAQIYNLLCDPDPWLNKIIRMAGYYTFFEDLTTGTVYHACFVPDATACCAQGIEFVLASEYTWPDEYPEEGTDIVVTGRLEMYTEDGVNYLHLADAELVWDQE